jgi:hypothetical protein
MKTVDFLDYFEFEPKAGGRGRTIQENECSVLYNTKNMNYYFRFAGSRYKYLKIGKAQGGIFFVLNNESGIYGRVDHKGSKKPTIAFNNKEAVQTILAIATNDFNPKENYKCILEFDKIEQDSNVLVLKLNNKA